MRIPDPYKTLGITKNQSIEQVKDAYKNLAKKYHPNSNSGHQNSQKFLEIKDAYDWLILHHIPQEVKPPLILDNKIKIYRFTKDLTFDTTDRTYIVKIWESDVQNDGIIFIMDMKSGREVRIAYKANIPSGSIATVGKTSYKIMVLEEKF